MDFNNYKIKTLFAITAGLFLLSFGISLATEFTLDYPDFATASSPAEFVDQLYTYALGISASLAVMMIIYGGVKYAVNPGNQSALSDAKDIIQSSVWGIVLLAGAFLILNTVNPSLTELKNPGLETVPTSTSSAPVVDSDEAVLAAGRVIASGIALDNRADCVPGSDARSVVNDVAQSKYPLVCSSGCSVSGGCVAGGTSGTININTSLLNTIAELQEIVSFGTGNPWLSARVTSLTGGKHKSDSKHYNGTAVDLVPNSSGGNLERGWRDIPMFLRNKGASYVQCEVGTLVSGSCKNVKKEDCDIAKLTGSNKCSAHIHAQW
ncbi:MAG: pilin [Candidatus Paceibacterota bacterium]|jgi:hypothetical protein